MDNTAVFVFFLVACAFAGYSMLVAARHFVDGVRSAKKGMDNGHKEQTRYHEDSDSYKSDEDADSHETDNREDVGNQAWQDILGVSREASYEDVKIAYRRLIRRYHPDRVVGLGPEFQHIAEQRTKEINAAYEVARKLHGR